MQKIVSSSGLLFCIFFNFLNGIGYCQSNPWSYLGTLSVGGVGGDVGRTITTDNFGNVFFAGDFGGTVNFAPPPGVFNLTANSGSDAFISGYNVGAGYLGTLRIGGNGSEHINAIRARNGNIVYVGEYQLGNYPVTYSMDFNPFSTTYGFPSGAPFTPDMFTSHGDNDLFITKINPAGYQWTISIGGASWEQATDVAIDSNDNIYVIGYYANSFTDFDPGPATYNLISNAGFNTPTVFVASYDTNKTFRWAKTFVGWPGRIKVDSQDNVVITGFINSYNGTAIPGYNGTINLSPASQANSFVAKLDSLGNYFWFGTISAAPSVGIGPAWLFSTALALDAADNIYVGGYFSHPSDFDPTSGTFIVTPSINVPNGGLGTNIFVEKLTPTGNLVWVDSFGAGITSYDQPTDLVVNNCGQVEVTGTFLGTADFDPGPGVQNSSSGLFTKAFLSVLDAGTGAYIGHGIYGSNFLNITPTAIAKIGNGITLLTGGYYSITDFDPTANSALFTSTSSAPPYGSYSQDAYINVVRNNNCL